jgi:PAS domain S-box-containing protein
MKQALTESIDNSLLRISDTVRSSLEHGKIYENGLRELGRILSVDTLLFTIDKESSSLATLSSYKVLSDTFQSSYDHRIELFPDLIKSFTENILCFDSAEVEPWLSPLRTVLRPLGSSFIFLTLRVEESEPLLLLVSSDRPRRWTDKDINIAKYVADQMSRALDLADQYRDSQDSYRREALLNRVGNSYSSLSDYISAVTAELVDFMKVSRAFIVNFDEAANSSTNAEYRYIARSRKPLIINDCPHYLGPNQSVTESIRSKSQEHETLSQIITPVFLRGELIAALHIQSNELRRWTEGDVKLVSSIAEKVGREIEQIERSETLFRTRDQWETTFDAISDGVFIFDREGRLTRVNRAGALLESTFPEMLIGKSCCQILRMAGSNCIVKRSILEQRRISAEVAPEHMNRTLMVIAEPLNDSNGKHTGSVLMVRDLSDLRKVQAVARESESLLGNILESAREAIFALDNDGRIKWCNKGIEISGHTAKELIGVRFSDIAHSADEAPLSEAFMRALGGESLTIEIRFRDPLIETKHALLDYGPLLVDGEVTGVLGIARDITQQKIEREKASQADKLRALGQLASGVAHDLNNSLAAVLGRAQLLSRVLKESKALSSLDVIKTAAADAAATVRRIQTFARHPRSEEFKLLDIQDLLRDSIELTRTRWENDARSEGLHYTVELEPCDHHFTLGCPSELREVFVNLIVNAIDAMPDGGSLKISTQVRDGAIRIFFADTGVGIPEESYQRIFEPFYTTKGPQGTGLGLFVSYGIIGRHKGALTVESRAGIGTTFIVELTLADSHPQPVIEKEISSNSSNLSVLVVDDESIVRETLSEIISSLGHKVTEVDSGDRALEWVESKEFDMVFTDLSMPGMDGWEMAREIRKIRPRIKIVMVTGYGNGVSPAPGDESVLNGIIGKPFDFSQVAQAIDTYSCKAEALHTCS